MNLQHPKILPSGYTWSASDIPPKCGPGCGIPILPVQFVVVWHGNFALDQPRINPWTNQPEMRHLLACQELWYFMTAHGCWSAAPSGFPSQPAGMHGAFIAVKTEDAPDHETQWELLAAEMYKNGALPPRTIHAINAFRKNIPLPGGWSR